MAESIFDNLPAAKDRASVMVPTLVPLVNITLIDVLTEYDVIHFTVVSEIQELSSHDVKPMLPTILGCRVPNVPEENFAHVSLYTSAMETL